MRRRRLVLRCWPLLALLAACAPQAPPAPERPLRIAVHSDPLSLDPHFKNEVLTYSILANVYETLTDFGANMRIRPALAERWENPDEITWRFVLRPGVRFHDGRELGAADVVASLERARRHPRSNFSSYLVAVDEVRAVDRRTVEITTLRPYPILLNKLAFVAIVPADQRDADEIRQPIGTGPYRLTAYRPGEKVELSAFAGYRSGAAAEPRVEFVTIADPEQRLALLLAGEVDLVHHLRPEDVDRLGQAEGCRLLSSDSLVVEYLSLRTSKPPFSDPRVRRAIDLAIDRRQLVDTALGGQAEPLGQMAGINVFGYDPEIEPPERDLDQARALLAEAGYPDGLDLEIELRLGRPVDVLGEQLAEAGIRVRPTARPWPEMYRRLDDDQVDFYLGGVLAITADASDIFDSIVHSRDPDKGYGQSNHLRYSNPELDRWIEESGRNLDMIDRRSTLQRGMRLVAEDRGFLALYAPRGLYGVRDGVEWQPRIDGMLIAYEMRREPSP
jgi:peptide/nickel transport system substrate-binding protein